MTFWDRFYNLCLERNTKPLPVVKSLSIGAGSVTKWKNGTIPNGETLTKIADYFDVSTDYLLGLSDVPNPDPLHGLEFAFEGEVNDFTEEERQDLIDFVRYIKSKRKDQPPQK